MQVDLRCCRGQEEELRYIGSKIARYIVVDDEYTNHRGALI